MRRPRRPRLGQHFLVDAAWCRRIAEAIEFEAGELVIEIGPGRGALTHLLAARAGRLVAIERDERLARALGQELAADSPVEVVCGDILAADIGEICRRQGVRRCAVWGNLPYYITSPILHHLLGFHRFIRVMALMVQREVAERLLAAPGSRDYGYLTVFTQLYSEPRLLMKVPRGAFSPPPRVDSALVGFRVGQRLAGLDAEAFLKFAGRCFRQKRKSLANNLAAGYGRDRVVRALATLNLEPGARAEQASLEQLAGLYRLLGPPA